MKRMEIILIALVCAMTLSGCMPLSVNLQRADQPVSLPSPGVQPVEPAVGDSLPVSSQYVPLYFVSEDQQLVAFSRAITAEPGQSLISQALQALLRAEDTGGAISPFPEGTRLNGVERSGNIAVVDLSIDARNVESDQQLMWMREVIAATLIGLDGVECVNVLIAGRDEGILSLPSGAMISASPDLTAGWTRISTEQELLSQSESESASAERTAILYYPTKDEMYIAPVAQTVRITGNDFIMPVIEALMKQPEEDGCLRSPFPRNAQVLAAEPEIVETESGRRMARIAFDASLIAMLEREGLSEWQLYASLTYTLTGFVPDLDGLIVLLGDGQLTRTGRNGSEVSFTGGEMTRSLYPDAVCRLAAAYMSAQDGGLLRLLRPLDQLSAVSPRALLGELFKGPAEWEEGAARVLPDGVSIDDILGIRISGGEAAVNLSSNFYRCCQSLTAQQEQNLIYAMVNTLTELPSVSAVRFQVEGETVDHLVSALFLRGALMRNPGIIRQAE